MVKLITYLLLYIEKSFSQGTGPNSEPKIPRAVKTVHTFFSYMLNADGMPYCTVQYTTIIRLEIKGGKAMSHADLSHLLALYKNEKIPRYIF